MNRAIAALSVLIILTTLSAGAQQFGSSACDYEPPESRVVDLGLQGAFNWYDGAFTDDRNRTISASLLSEFTSLFSSASSGWTLDGRAEVRLEGNAWSGNLAGSGSLSSFFDDDLFGVGALGFDASSDAGFELDLTGGVGKGRFRDVTPLAQANEIQNTLLDLGELLAPIADTTLLDLARILGEVGPTDEDKVVRLAERLVATDLIPGNDLGVRGLLAIESVLSSLDETRLCGYDVQARLGASAMFIPEFSLAATGILEARYAVVPTPVSRFRASAEAKFRLAHPDQLSVVADVSYSHRLPDGWTGRVDYRLGFDRLWSAADVISMSHAIFATLNVQIFGSTGLSLVGSGQYKTGDEEITLALSVFLEAELF
ncbi:hypothetical protein ACFLSZ_02685 [Candidatus Bipolaricaulota bacterium]